MIRFKDVSKIYNHRSIALEDINLRIKSKEFVCLAGPSGAGKTTLLRLLIAEECPTKGEVWLGKLNINKLRSKHMPYLRRRIGMIFQDFKLLSNKNAYENIAFAMEVWGVDDKEIKKDVFQVLELVGLQDKADHFPYQLSGGEKQRIAIARALIHRPEIIIADEPTGNLDSVNTWEIINLLNKINELGTTVVLATHDRDVINNLKKRVIVIEKGKVVSDEEGGKYIN
ncbi:MAG: cell division ATP-binding protein FtsE [Candidatus Portnoybacteria bacterium CG10_big_fil_rev_8_21_14_0_10_36_7]|uniref:Cell division ATP-binding protein FtsE n=1 Tax=Candidatus Portnoybacteria bacterium CG10_big_fil_rev_8_21_14_0_10_36_7 TaxID=1974812 RepID=A0A2M8KE32_9BACT|nr:MAG: cell division ATP-binding protein FtsE [Candidatus Portnoybacteria bacterium CG10_big_fil_rev_8_21_14_0_10_36_7]